MSRHRLGLTLVLLPSWLLSATLGCEEDKKPTSQSVDQSLKVAKKPEKPVVKKPKAPTFSIDESSVKLSYDRYLIDRPNAREELAKELGTLKSFVDGQTLKLTIHRKAKQDWVSAYLEVLADQGASAFEITTPTRDDYAKTVTFYPWSAAAEAPACSVVSIISEDRSTATWRLSGGKARQRRRGLGGPDLSMTGLTIESVAKGCKQSEALFVSAHTDVEWGLVYDLAASTHTLEKVSFSRFFLPPSKPTPGKKVER